MKYKIPVIYEMYGTYEVEADSVEEAIAKTVDDPTVGVPDWNAVVLDDSMQVDKQGIMEKNHLTDADFSHLETYREEFFR